MKFLILLMTLTMPFLVFAHEDHDHGSPKDARPLKGGLVQRLEEVHVEVVPRGNSVRIYLLDLKSEKAKSMNFADFTISAKAELPRAKTSSTLKLEAKDGYYETTYDAKGAHRYNLVISLAHKPTNHADVLTFVIEPKK